MTTTGQSASTGVDSPAQPAGGRRVAPVIALVALAATVLVVVVAFLRGRFAS